MTSENKKLTNEISENTKNFYINGTIRTKNYENINRKTKENMIKIFDLINEYKKKTMPHEEYSEFEGSITNSEIANKAIEDKLDKTSSRIDILGGIIKRLDEENEWLREF